MTSPALILLLVAFVIIVAGGSWRRKGSPQLAPGTRKMVLAGLTAFGVILLVLLFVRYGGRVR